MTDLVEETAHMIAEAPPELLEGGKLPVQRVCDILAFDDDEQQSKLQEHEGTAEEVSSVLQEYINEHYENFNESIIYFSEMIVRIGTAKDAVSAVKSNIGAAATLLRPREVELRESRRRWARGVVRGQLLSEMEACVHGEARAIRLQNQGNAVGAVKNLRKFGYRASKLAVDGVVTFEPLASRIRQRLAILPLQEARQVLDAVFSLSPTRVDLTVLPEPQLIDERCKVAFDHVKAIPLWFLCARVRAVHVTGDSRVLVNALELEALKRLPKWFLAAIDAGVAVALDRESVSARVQKFITFMTEAVECMLRRAAAVALFGACCDLPLLSELFKRDTMDDPETWPINDFVTDAIVQIANEAASAALTQVGSRGADHQAAMNRFTQGLTNALPRRARLMDLLQKVDELHAALHGAVMNKHAVDDCAALLKRALRRASINDASKLFESTTRRWSLRSLWNATQTHLVRLIDNLLGTDLNRQESVKNQDRKGQLPLDRVKPVIESLSSMLSHRGKTGAPQFLEQLGPVNVTSLENAARQLSMQTKESESYMDATIPPFVKLQAPGTT
jgi:hypothetical protein